MGQQEEMFIAKMMFGFRSEWFFSNLKFFLASDKAP